MTYTTTTPSYKNDVQALVQQVKDMMPADKFAVFDQDSRQLAKAHRSPLKLTKGDKAPQFSLPDALGHTVDLAVLLEQGPVVLTFYRGAWCPYCNLQLKNYQEILPRIKAAGASLVAVSPMSPDHSLGIKETNELKFDVLSDVDNKVARLFTTVFRNGEAPIKAMSDLGYDFYSFYDNNSAELPVPATFVIARNSDILLADSGGGDYKVRVEAQAILDALES